MILKINGWRLGNFPYTITNNYWNGVKTILISNNRLWIYHWNTFQTFLWFKTQIKSAVSVKIPTRYLDVLYSYVGGDFLLYIQRGDFYLLLKSFKEKSKIS